MPIEKIAEKAVEKAPSWIKSVLLPEFNDIKSEMKAVAAKIESLEMLSKFEITDNKIDSLRNETKIEIV